MAHYLFRKREHTQFQKLKVFGFLSIKKKAKTLNTVFLFWKLMKKKKIEKIIWKIKSHKFEEILFSSDYLKLTATRIFFHRIL
jgi:hypothetical protein